MMKTKRIDQFIHRFVDGINVPLLVLDLKKLTILHSNPAFEELAGRPCQEMARHPLTDLFSQKSAQRVMALCELMSQSENNKLEEHDCELIRRSGRRLTVSMLASTVFFERHKFLLLSIHDLSYLKALQNQREVTLKELGQISKLADIGLLTAGVAHELNNPLMIVQGYAENLEVLLNQLEDVAPEVKNHVAEILRASERMSRLIGQMARMVRSTEINFEVVDLQEVVQNSLVFLDYEIKKSDVDIQLSFGPQNLVKCDHHQIEQVILNILSNALHALEHRTQDRQIKLTCLAKADSVDLLIWNNGPSIPSHIQEKLMTPFFTTKEVGKGTGLGLAVSYGIMKAHGGTLDVESSEENGTQFRLSFPTPQVIPFERLKLKKSSVLLVDDDPAVLDVLSHKFKLFGFTVCVACHGSEACRILASQPHFGAVFIDLRMPDMDGLTLCRKIRELHKSSPLPMVVMSGYAWNSTLEKALKAEGVMGFLTKPINHEAFVEILKELEKRSASSPHKVVA